ncbi:MAG: FlgO family outer membrane protein, partial [Luminiphilus sp.]
LLAGCAGYHGSNAASAAIYSGKEQSVDIRHEVEQACSKLIRRAKHTNKREDTLLVASFTDLGALDRSSKLGRLMGQDCSTEAVKDGYKVTETLLADSLFIDPNEGELMLSRDLSLLAQSHDATAVLVGTYTVGRNTVYANARLIRSQDALVLSAVSFELPLTREVTQLVARGAY